MIAAEIRADQIHVVVCPGELDQHTRMITGRWTTEFILRLNFDLAFVSAAGVTLEAGLTTSRGPIADVLRAARDVAARTVALVDSSKFGRASLVSIAPVHALDLVISDGALEPDTEAEFRSAGVDLRLATGEGAVVRGRARTTTGPE
jgi:DeoR family fructose operon transcriptional repressor